MFRTGSASLFWITNASIFIRSSYMLENVSWQTTLVSSTHHAKMTKRDLIQSEDKLTTTACAKKNLSAFELRRAKW
jgi:hypothetical protein